MRKKNTTPANIAIQFSATTIFANTILSAFKLLAGILAQSSAMISDAIHTISDVLSTLLVIAGVKISTKTEDKNHPYGHERMECIVALALSAILFVIGTTIGFDGIQKIYHHAQPLPPNLFFTNFALGMAILSIAAKEWMYWYTIKAAKQINSSALLADAWHHRSDALSSLGSFIGILGIRLGLPFLDPLACFVICVFILKTSYDIAKEAIHELIDHACDEKTIQQMKECILQNVEILRLDVLKTRLFGAKIYADLEISLDSNLNLQQAHAIATKVHNQLESTFPDMKHCMVHVNPYSNDSHHHL